MTPMKILPAFLFCAVLLGCPGPAPTVDAGTLDSGTPSDGGYTCTTEVIDGDAGAKIVSFISLDLDSTGAPHVAYYDNAKSTLRYASHTASGWTTTLVTTQGNGGSLMTLKLDAAGKARISYYNSTAVAVMYANNATGTFVTEEVAKDTGSNSLALDGTGAPRIALASNGIVKWLKLATRTGTTWTLTDIDAVGPASQPSLAIDAAGKNHVSWYDLTVGSLKYATDATGTWVLTTVDAAMVGGGSSLKLDANGKVHITYGDSGNKRVKYATNVSGTFVAITIDAAGPANLGGETSLAIDPAGKLYLTYYQDVVRDLGYATNRSGTWAAIPLVAGANDYGYAHAMAIDAARDRLHAAFSDRTTGGYGYVICQ